MSCAWYVVLNELFDSSSNSDEAEILRILAKCAYQMSVTVYFPSFFHMQCFVTQSGTSIDQHTTQKENWLVSGPKDHRNLSATDKAKVAFGVDTEKTRAGVAQR